jgi:hypothetical protein
VGCTTARPAATGVAPSAPDVAKPTSAATAPPATEPAPSRWTWTGFEIVGRRLHSREEIAALLPVELGAPYPEEADAVFERCNEVLRAELDVAHVVCSNVLFLTGEAYLVVEVVEHGEEERLAFREPPSGDAPLDPALAALYQRLISSLMAAFQAGTDVGETMEPGYLDYEHPEMHAVVEEMRRAVPPRREELLRVLAESPEGADRARAAWMLNWAGDEADSIARVHGFLDDPHGVTRNDVSRFMVHYLDRVEDEATLRAVVDSLAIQLSRPSHGDRNKAAYCLKTLLQAHPGLAPYVAERAGPWLRRIAGQSILDNVGGLAREVVAMLDAAPASPSTPPAG